MTNLRKKRHATADSRTSSERGRSPVAPSPFSVARQFPGLRASQGVFGDSLEGFGAGLPHVWCPPFGVFPSPTAKGWTRGGEVGLQADTRNPKGEGATDGTDDTDGNREAGPGVSPWFCWRPPRPRGLLSSVKSVSSVALFRGPCRRACGGQRNLESSVARSFAHSGLRIIYVALGPGRCPSLTSRRPVRGWEPVAAASVPNPVGMTCL